jgi:hypothetical protein
MLEYWHMGETPMRLRNSTERSWKGEKSGVGISKSDDSRWIEIQHREKQFKTAPSRLSGVFARLPSAAINLRLESTVS